MNGFRITTKVSLLSGACALIAFVGALVLLSRVAANTEAEEGTFRAALQQTEWARIMQVDFKKQVQEWKDILLRGHDAADLERYHRQFLTEENLVESDGKMLSAALTEPVDRAAVDEFLRAHEALGRSYREALDVFVQSGRVDYKAADRKIRGMDRAPTDQIDDIVGTIKKRWTDTFASRQAVQEKERKLTTLAIAVFSAGLIAGTFWASRRILMPVRNLTTTMSRVSSEKDYSLRVTPGSRDELGKLAEVFNEMLATIQRQNAALEQVRDDLEQQLEEHKQTGTRLAQSLSMLGATIDSTADGLLVVDVNGRVTALNRKFGDMWRIPSEILATCDDRQILPLATAQLKDPAGFLEKVRHLYADPNAESFDVLVFQDGRIFERYSQPQRIDGVPVGRVWSFHDVTGRKQAEAELERLNTQLLQTAHHAGMAEVATGVLHNVGNVLNSVNVAATCVADSLKRSKSPNLSKVVALMREHETDLGDFLTRDPKGKLLVAYLAQLGELLAGEQATVLTELAELQKNVAHIKEIVTQQQSLSKSPGALEPVNSGDLMDDAVKINQSSLARHDIEVVREFADVPLLVTGKNQVLQILVNLVRNAIEASAESPQGLKRITLRITGHADRVRFAVADNGIGIAPENFARMFSHGFTTKKDGHGFGLHSSALITRELGGTLNVQSDGPCKGAVFLLELPIQSAERALA